MEDTLLKACSSSHLQRQDCTIDQRFASYFECERYCKNGSLPTHYKNVRICSRSIDNIHNFVCMLAQLGSKLSNIFSATYK